MQKIINDTINFLFSNAWSGKVENNIFLHLTLNESMSDTNAQNI